MTDIVQTLQSQPWFTIVSAVITLASAIAAFTPTPAANSVWAKVYAIIDLLALNIGKAKDKGTVAPVTPPVVK